jgi:hypothetical protein
VKNHQNIKEENKKQKKKTKDGDDKVSTNLSLLHKSHLVLKLVTKHRPPLGIKKKKSIISLATVSDA